MANLNILDILIGFFIFSSAWRGFGAGAIKTSVSLAAYLMALIIASYFADDLSFLLAPYFDSAALTIAATFLALVLAVIFGLRLLANTLSSAAKSLKLGFVDKLLGGLLGVALGVVKLLIILSVTSPLLMHWSNWQSSVFLQHLLPYAPIAADVLKQFFSDVWQQIDNPWRAI